MDLVGSQSYNSKPVSNDQADYAISSSPVEPDVKSAKGKGIEQPGSPKAKSNNSHDQGNDDKTKNNDRNPDLLSQDEQIELGDEVARQEHLDDDIYIDSRINRIAKRLIRNLPARYSGPANDGWQWRIRCKRTSNHEVNAIALPGGRIYVYEGILELTRKEDELAAVLAHEIIHVVEEHSAEQLAKSGDIQRATARIVSKVNGGDEQSQKGKITAIAGALGAVLVKMHLNRRDEYQADERGLQLLVKAGYNPAKALVFFEKIQAIESSADDDQGILGRAFSSHPPTVDRIANLREKIPTYTKQSIDNAD